MRRTAWLLAGLTACASPAVDLDAPADAGAGATDAGRDAGAAPPDAGLDPAACAALNLIPDANVTALRRLGIQLSGTVVEGEVSEPLTNAGRTVARLRIDRVWRGHQFLAGQEVSVALSGESERRGGFPQAMIFGLTGRGLPVIQDSGPPRLETRLVGMPAADSDTVQDLLHYDKPPAPVVVSVRVIESWDRRVYVEVLERLEGEAPDIIIVDWGAPYLAEFPEPGPEAFLATFAGPLALDSRQRGLGVTLDFQPDTPEAREAVLFTRPGLDTSGLAARAQAYRASWAFRRAPRVVASVVTGVAPAAEGVYVEHEVQADLRGEAGARFVQRAAGPGGGCGMARLVATDALVAESAPSAFSCRDDADALQDGLPVSVVRAELSDDPTARRAVEGWLSAPGPHYRLWRLADAPALGAPEQGPWSEALPVPAALAAADLRRARVVSVSEQASGTEIALEMAGGPAWTGPTEIHRLAFACGDPRLLLPGTEWIVPWLGSGGDDLGFLLPGAIFIADGPAVGIAEALRARLVPGERE